MRRALALLLLLALVPGCTAASGPAAGPSDPTQSPSPPASTRASASAPPSPASPSPSPGGTSAKTHPVSVPALFDKRYDGRRLRLGQVLLSTDAYTQRAVTFRGDNLTVSGVMNLPTGPGPFPVLVLAHGYIDPDIYVTGQGLRREQDWLARAGYAVLHVDYRNHAASDRDPRADLGMRLGYTVDVVNAVHAIRRSGLRRLDRERIGLLGRSMGGGVVYNALTVAPGLVDAAVVFAPVSSRTKDNFNRWIRDDPQRSGLSSQIIDTFGAPERNPRFWREVSPRPYFDRITEPLLIHHGTADASCPIRWSRASYRALRAAGVDVEMFTYPGEPHAFVDAWPLSMRRTVAFFERHLG